MTALVGCWRCPPETLPQIVRQVSQGANRTPVRSYRRDMLEVSLVSAASGRSPGCPEAKGAEDIVAFVAGEIHSLCGAHNPLPDRSAEFLKSAYRTERSTGFLRDASGAFTAVLHDAGHQTLLLLTDPLGLGSLFFYWDRTQLVFSSEMKAFGGLSFVPQEVDPGAAASFLRHGHLAGDESWFLSIRRLRAGHYLLFNTETGELAEHRYAWWDRPSIAPFASYDEARVEVEQAFRRSCDVVRADDRPLLVEVGGDLASRMVYAHALTKGPEDLVAVTCAAPDTERHALARAACAVGNSPQRSCHPFDESWLSRQARACWLADGADLGLHAAIPQIADAFQPVNRRCLLAGLGEVLLGSAGLEGLRDDRVRRVFEIGRRRESATLTLWSHFATGALPFADSELFTAALRLDASHLLDDAILVDVVRSIAPAPLFGVPATNFAGKRVIGSPASRRAASYRSEVELWTAALSKATTSDLVWDLLSDHNSLYRTLVDPKPALATYFDPAESTRPESHARMVRYVTLELWLRQLLRGESLPDSGVKALHEQCVPRVSVIVPAFNVEPYLGECLNSLINQEQRDVEVLLVNDGSTDGTLAVAQRFARADSRIRVINRSNTGVYASRNVGLAESRGEYVSFVDSDDYVHPAMLAKLIEGAERHAADVAFCDVYQFSELESLSVRKNTLAFKAESPLDLASAPQMIRDGFTTLWNRVYRRDFLGENQLGFDESLRISADMLFLQEVLVRAKTIVRVPEPLYYYRFGTPKGLTSHEVRNDRYREHLKITLELIDFWRRQGVLDRYASHVLTKATRNFLWNTHIDVSKLREIFGEFHSYVAALSIPPPELAGMPRFEREVLRTVHLGDFAAFARIVGPYRARMVEAKGGRLTTRERLACRAREVRELLASSISVSARHNSAQRELQLRSRHGSATLAIKYGRLADRYTSVHLTRLQEEWRRRNNLRALARQVEGALANAKPEARLRVLHVSRVFSAPSETFTYDVISGLERTPQTDNYVACLVRDLIGERPFPKVIQLLGVSRPSLDAASTEVVESFAVLLGRLRPDLIHCHFGWVGVPVVAVLGKLGVRTPVVITMHGSDVNMWPRKYRWYRDALRTLGTRPWVTLTTHSETYRKKLMALGVRREQVAVIPNSFDPGFAQAGSRSAFERGSLLRVICVARMDIWKGQEYLIRAFSHFHRHVYPSSTLTLVGYGPREADLRALVDSLGLADVVRFRGRLAHYKVALLLRHHDVYVQPSICHQETMQEEGQPIAVLEAIAAGMPVIVTDTGAVAETVKVGPYEGNAYVVESRSAVAIAGALEEVVRAPRSSGRADEYIRMVSQKHSQERQLAATLKHYEGVTQPVSRRLVHKAAFVESAAVQSEQAELPPAVCEE